MCNYSWKKPALPSKLSWLQAFIGIGLSIAQTAGKGHDTGTALGVLSLASTTPAQGTWNLFVALGSIAFAYAFVSCVQLLKSLSNFFRFDWAAQGFIGLLKKHYNSVLSFQMIAHQDTQSFCSPVGRSSNALQTFTMYHDVCNLHIQLLMKSL